MEYGIVRANATKGRPEFFDLCGCQPNHYMTEMVSLLRGLTFKHESTPASAFCGSLVMLSGLALAETFVREVVGAEEAMLFIGSFAAMATLLFAAPAAPLGIPWNTLLGHGVSISIALGVHWLQLLSGLNLAAKVIVPSLAIATMAKFKVTNPPAAAAATIFSTSSLAQAQPLWGALFLLSPALVGCAWAFLVQFAVAKGVTLRLCHSGERRVAQVGAVEPTVRVSVVDSAVALCIVQAVEGAAFVDDPLSFMIDALIADRTRLQRQKSVLKAMGVHTVNPWADPEKTPQQRRLAALGHIQRWVRVILPKVRAKRAAELV